MRPVSPGGVDSTGPLGAGAALFERGEGGRERVLAAEAGLSAAACTSVGASSGRSTTATRAEKPVCDWGQFHWLMHRGRPRSSRSGCGGGCRRSRSRRRRRGASGGGRRLRRGVGGRRRRHATSRGTPLSIRYGSKLCWAYRKVEPAGNEAAADTSAQTRLLEIDRAQLGDRQAARVIDPGEQ